MSGGAPAVNRGAAPRLSRSIDRAAQGEQSAAWAVLSASANVVAAVHQHPKENCAADIFPR
jgi:hypothetical protein